MFIYFDLISAYKMCSLVIWYVFLKVFFKYSIYLYFSLSYFSTSIYFIPFVICQKTHFRLVKKIKIYIIFILF